MRQCGNWKKRLELLVKIVPHANLPKKEERGTEARILSSATAPSRKKETSFVRDTIQIQLGFDRAGKKPTIATKARLNTP